MSGEEPKTVGWDAIDAAAPLFDAEIAGEQLAGQRRMIVPLTEQQVLDGVQVVDRGGAEAHLRRYGPHRERVQTALGQQVATQARLVLSDVADLVEIASGGRQPLTGDLRLGVIPTIAPFLLPRHSYLAVRIIASEKYRIEQLRQRHHLTAREARRLIDASTSR